MELETATTEHMPMVGTERSPMSEPVENTPLNSGCSKRTNDEASAPDLVDPAHSEVSSGDKQRIYAAECMAMGSRPTEGKARRDSDTHQALMELNAQTDEATDALRYQAPARPDHTQEEVIRNLQFWLKENYDWDGPLDGWTGKVVLNSTQRKKPNYARRWYTPSGKEFTCRPDIAAFLGLGSKSKPSATATASQHAPSAAEANTMTRSRISKRPALFTQQFETLYPHHAKAMLPARAEQHMRGIDRDKSQAQKKLKHNPKAGTDGDKCEAPKKRVREGSDGYKAQPQEKVLRSSLGEKGLAYSWQAPARVDDSSDEVVQNLQSWLKDMYDWDTPLHGWTGKTVRNTQGHQVRIWQTPCGKQTRTRPQSAAYLGLKRSDLVPKSPGNLYSSVAETMEPNMEAAAQKTAADTAKLGQLQPLVDQSQAMASHTVPQQLCDSATEVQTHAPAALEQQQPTSATVAHQQPMADESQVIASYAVADQLPSAAGVQTPTAVERAPPAAAVQQQQLTPAGTQSVPSAAVAEQPPAPAPALAQPGPPAAKPQHQHTSTVVQPPAPAPMVQQQSAPVVAQAGAPAAAVQHASTAPTIQPQEPAGCSSGESSVIDLTDCVKEEPTPHPYPPPRPTIMQPPPNLPRQETPQSDAEMMAQLQSEQQRLQLAGRWNVSIHMLPPGSSLLALVTEANGECVILQSYKMCNNLLAALIERK